MYDELFCACFIQSNATVGQFGGGLGVPRRVRTAAFETGCLVDTCGW